MILNIFVFVLVHISNQDIYETYRDEKVQDWSGFPDWALAYDLYNDSCFCWNLFLNEVNTQF